MGFSIFHYATALLFFMFVATALRSLGGSAAWTTQKLVLRAHYISFEPFSAHSEFGGIGLSEAAKDLSQGEPAFSVIIGRPAGLINFLREGVGLSRRFEFVFSQHQAITRYASFTTHLLHCARLEGLNSIEAARKRPNPLLLFSPFALTFVIVSAISASMTGGDDSDLITGFCVAFGGCALYYLTQRITRISLREAGNPEIRFEIFPPVLERIFRGGAPEMPLEDAIRIIQIFRVLKGS